MLYNKKNNKTFIIIITFEYIRCKRNNKHSERFNINYTYKK